VSPAPLRSPLHPDLHQLINTRLLAAGVYPEVAQGSVEHLRRALRDPDAPEPSPPFAYTVGLSRPQFGHPELLVFGPDPDLNHARTILNALGERVRGGQRLHAGQRLGDVLGGGYEVELVRIDNPRRPTGAAWGRHPVVRAGRHHRGAPGRDARRAPPVPWDPGFDPEMWEIQLLLGHPTKPNR
jgi:hypothetical protein